MIAEGGKIFPATLLEIEKRGRDPGIVVLLQKLPGDHGVGKPFQVKGAARALPHVGESPDAALPAFVADVEDLAVARAQGSQVAGGGRQLPPLQGAGKGQDCVVEASGDRENFALHSAAQEADFLAPPETRRESGTLESQAPGTFPQPSPGQLPLPLVGGFAGRQLRGLEGQRGAGQDRLLQGKRVLRLAGQKFQDLGEPLQGNVEKFSRPSLLKSFERRGAGPPLSRNARQARPRGQILRAHDAPGARRDLGVLVFQSQGGVFQMPGQPQDPERVAFPQPGVALQPQVREDQGPGAVAAFHGEAQAAGGKAVRGLAAAHYLHDLAQKLVLAPESAFAFDQGMVLGALPRFPDLRDPVIQPPVRLRQRRHFSSLPAVLPAQDLAPAFGAEYLRLVRKIKALPATQGGVAGQNAHGHRVAARLHAQAPVGQKQRLLAFVADGHDVRPPEIKAVEAQPQVWRGVPRTFHGQLQLSLGVAFQRLSLVVGESVIPGLDQFFPFPGGQRDPGVPFQGVGFVFRGHGEIGVLQKHFVILFLLQPAYSQPQWEIRPLGVERLGMDPAPELDEAESAVGHGSPEGGIVREVDEPAVGGSDPFHRPGRDVRHRQAEEGGGGVFPKVVGGVEPALLFLPSPEERRAVVGARRLGGEFQGHAAVPAETFLRFDPAGRSGIEKLPGLRLIKTQRLTFVVFSVSVKVGEACHGAFPVNGVRAVAEPQLAAVVGHDLGKIDGLRPVGPGVFLQGVVLVAGVAEQKGQGAEILFLPFSSRLFLQGQEDLPGRREGGGLLRPPFFPVPEILPGRAAFRAPQPDGVGAEGSFVSAFHGVGPRFPGPEPGGGVPDLGREKKGAQMLGGGGEDQLLLLACQQIVGELFLRKERSAYDRGQQPQEQQEKQSHGQYQPAPVRGGKTQHALILLIMLFDFCQRNRNAPPVKRRRGVVLPKIIFF